MNENTLMFTILVSLQLKNALQGQYTVDYLASVHDYGNGGSVSTHSFGMPNHNVLNHVFKV